MAREITITVSGDLRCPRCGAQEVHPTLPDSVLIRGFKVHHAGHWWSQCLVCAGYYDANLVSTPATYDPKKGWF